MSAEDPFGRRKFGALDANCLAQRPADGLEARLDHVMVVFSADVDVERGAE